MTTITEEKLQTDSVTQYWTKINILPQPKGKTTTDWKASAEVLLQSPLFFVLFRCNEVFCGKTVHVHESESCFCNPDEAV